MNALQDESSPYLRQHQENPIHWYAWHNDALTKAKVENKLIFLSIGYAACHWCHVMASECFEDSEVAERLNRDFIAIKVDKEERPDIDKVYQRCFHILNRNPGGWPLTIIMTPEQHVPILAATYLPKHQKGKLPGLLDVLDRVQAFFLDDKEAIATHQNALQDALILKPTENPGTETIRVSLSNVKGNFDPIQLGFGGAPKFPQAPLLLLCAHLAQTDEAIAHHFLATCQIMATSGLNDHLEGGFFRYCVDEQWAIPHFEKMLYDNALLIRCYALASMQLPSKGNKSILLNTVHWLEQHLQSEDGLFYSSLDADTAHQEGAYYLIEMEQLQATLSPEEKTWFNTQVSIHPLLDDSQLQHITCITDDASDTCQSVKQKLMTLRQQQARPAIDTKCLTAWNALLATSFFQAAIALQDSNLGKKGCDLLASIMHSVTVPDVMNILNSSKSYPGYLDDFVFLAEAHLMRCEYEWNDNSWEQCLILLDTILTKFYDAEENVFYFTANNTESLLFRPSQIYDDATPSAWGVVCQLLIKIASITGNLKFQEIAQANILSQANEIQRYPGSYASLAIAAELLAKPCKTAIVRYSDNQCITAWKQRLLQDPTYDIRLIIPEDSRVDSFKTKAATSAGTLYVCQDKQCLPVV